MFVITGNGAMLETLENAPFQTLAQSESSLPNLGLIKNNFCRLNCLSRHTRIICQHIRILATFKGGHFPKSSLAPFKLQLKTGSTTLDTAISNSLQ